MSVRQDKVQIVLEFLNEESKSLSKHVVDAQSLNKEIAKLATEEQKLAREMEKAAAAGKSTLDIEQKRTKVQAEINDKLMQVLKTGKGIEKLDLSKVVPAQLVSTAKELERSLAFLPKSTPQYEQVAAALKKVNDQLATNRAETKGVASGMQSVASEGTKLSHIFEIAFGVGIAEMVGRLIEKVKELGVELFNRSRELEGIGNKTKLVFGAAANDIEQFAAIMSEQVGESTDSVLDDLTDISNSFTTLEFGKKDVAGLTKQLYELSASWAQYNNGKYTALEVSEKFKIALGGEVDELAELGVVLTQDTLKKEMQKKGYDKLTGASFDQASALTLLELITRKTQEAQANFGNHAETMAAKQNRVAAFVHNAWDATARGLTNIFSGLLTFTEGFIAPFRDLTPHMTNLQKATEAEQHALNAAIERVTRYAIGTKERKAAMDSLIAIQPTFLKNLNAETVSNEQLRDRLQEVNAQYQAKIIAIAAGKQVEEALEKQKKAVQSVGTEIVKTSNRIVDARQFLNDYTSDAPTLDKKLREIFENAGAWDKLFDSRTRQAKELIGVSMYAQSTQEYAARATEQTSNAVVTARQREKQIIDELKKNYPEIAAQLDLIAATAEKATVKNENYAKSVNFAKEYDPAMMKQAAAAALKALEEAKKNELELVKAATERKLIVLEKERLEGLKTGVAYTNEYAKIRTDGFNNELAVYKKYKDSESLEAVRVAKEIVEIEKNRSEAILRLRLEDADKQASLARSLTERNFLQNTEGGLSPTNYDTEDRAYKKSLLQIDILFAQEKMRILKESHQEETKEYVDQQNRILKAKADIRNLDQAQTEADHKENAHRRSLAIDDEIAQLEEANAREDGVLRIRFANLMITEMDAAVASLNFKKAMLQQEIEILKSGGEAEIKQAKQKGIELAATEQEIELQKIKNKKRTIDLERELDQRRRDMTADALSIAIDFLSKDENARKKHASAIKAFEIGKVWTNAYSEISTTWQKNVEMFGPIIGAAISTAMTGLTLGRAIVNTRNIAAQKYAKGGFTDDIGLGRDETGEHVAGIVHAGEWVANREMVKKYPQLFRNLESMQRNGAKPFADGGSVGFNLSPRQDLVSSYTSTASPNYSSSSTQTDFNQLLVAFNGFTTSIESWQRSFEVKMYYTKFKDKTGEIESDLSAGSI